LFVSHPVEENDDERPESHESEDDEERSGHEPSAMELADDRENRRARAFEKNTFRNPKFWLRWKGEAQSSDDNGDDRKSVAESDTGYIVFANNTCNSFERRITCPSLEWKERRLRGRKTRPKATACTMAWNELV